jgi:GWxTD domain-containing protein
MMIGTWRPSQPLSSLLFVSLGVAFLVFMPPQSSSNEYQQEKPGQSENKGKQDGAVEKVAGADYGVWLNEVIYISTAQEREAFPQLDSNDKRAKFIKEFWERRNPEPGSRFNKFKDEYYRRLAYAKLHFHFLHPKLRDDRARIYLQFGPPDEIYHTDHGEPGRQNPKLRQLPVERWVYHFIEGIGKNVIADFTDPSSGGEYHVVVDPAILVDDRPSTGFSLGHSK